MNLIGGQQRRPVAVVVTSDGRRLNVPLDQLHDPAGVSPRSLVLFLLGLLGLITGSRRESGGRRTGR